MSHCSLQETWENVSNPSSVVVTTFTIPAGADDPNSCSNANLTAANPMYFINDVAIAPTAVLPTNAVDTNYTGDDILQMIMENNVPGFDNVSPPGAPTGNPVQAPQQYIAAVRKPRKFKTTVYLTSFFVFSRLSNNNNNNNIRKAPEN